MTNQPTARLLSLLLLFVIVFGGLVSASHASDASPPARMSYQGYLVDGDGVPLGNSAVQNFDVIFRIYNASQAGDILWAEQQTVTIDKGSFAVLLGEGSAVGSEPNASLDTVFTGQDVSDRFLGITVKGLGGTDAEILPRLRWLTSPFAFLAKNATTLVSPSGGESVVTVANGSIQTTGGNARGLGAVDLQATRTDATQVASGERSVVLGGENNTASGVRAVVPGGEANSAAGAYSFAAGRRAKANHQGSFVWADSTDADFSSTGINQFLIRANGGVGVNTASPDSGFPLSIQGKGGGSEWLKLISSSGVPKWHINNSAGGINFAESGVSDYRLFLEEGGYVGIGTSNPNYPLQVEMNGPSVGHGFVTAIYLSDDNMAIEGGGNTFIGFDSIDGPDRIVLADSDQSKIAYDFRMDGQCYFDFANTGSKYRGFTMRGSGSSWLLQIDDDSGTGDDDLDFVYNGNSIAWLDPGGAGTKGWRVSSDRRLKKNIEPYGTGILSKLKRIPVVKFHMNYEDDTRPKGIGFIAQDVQAEFPEIVDEEDGFLGLGYQDFGILAVGAIQELSAEKDQEITELRAENAELRNQMSGIQSQLNDIMARLNRLEGNVIQ